MLKIEHICTLMIFLQYCKLNFYLQNLVKAEWGIVLKPTILFKLKFPGLLIDYIT